MTRHSPSGMPLALLGLACCLSGCGGSSLPSTPSAPPASGEPPAPTLQLFVDSATGFSTTDLHDADDQIVQINSARELIWTADGTRLPGYRVTIVPMFERRWYFVTPALSGIVSAMTPDGVKPVAGANVGRAISTGWRYATTDGNGFYEMPGLIDGASTVSVWKDGYGTASEVVTMAGDTRFDIQLGGRY